MMLRSSQNFNLTQKNQGFSLMEVLISMIVIAIGLLGYMALQLASINSNQEGMARSQATLVAQELASSIRANRDYIFDNGGDSEYLVADNYISCTTKPSCTDGSCTNEEQAKVDTWQACQTIKGFTASTDKSEDDLLLNGTIRVGCVDRSDADADACSPGSTLSIYTYWANSSPREDVGQKDIAMNSRCTDFAGIAANKVTISAIGGANTDCLIVDIMP